MFNLFSHDEAGKHFDKLMETPHHEKLPYEVLAGAASFIAMRKYEEHLRVRGQPVSHATMKNFLAAAAAAELVHLVKTRGNANCNEEEAREHAKKQVEKLAEEHYGKDGTGFDMRHNEADVKAFKAYEVSDHVKHHGGLKETAKLEEFEVKN